MSQHDDNDTSNVISLESFINQKQKEDESGNCYTIMRGSGQAMTLEVRLPVSGRNAALRHRGFSYPIFDMAMTPKDGIVLETIKGTIINIKGNNLFRLFAAICDHKLRMVRPATKDKIFKDGEPKITKITIKEAE